MRSPKARDVLVLAPLVLLAGCRALPRAPEHRPADFSIAITVYPGPELRSGPVPDPGSEGGSPGERYVLEPDGALHSGVGAAVADHPLPPVLRRLDPAEHDRVYHVARQAGLFEVVRAFRVSGPETDTPLPGKPRVLVELASSGVRRTAAFDPRDVEGLDELLQSLRDLSWYDPDR